MPAYVNVQCFSEYNKETFNGLIKDFRMALNELGFSEYYIATYVNKVKWEISENGFMYTGCNIPSEKIKINEEYFYIRHLIIGFTHEGYNELKENWIEFAFLFEEDKIIKDYENGEMYSDVKQPIGLYLMCFQSIFLIQ